MKERDQGKQGWGVQGGGNYNLKGTYTLRKKNLKGKKIIVILQDICIDIASLESNRILKNSVFKKVTEFYKKGMETNK